ncbi:related to DNA polymerase alpha 70 kDa subunit [Ustilago bromivora]|uniref:DNA polymerase alpha subunit B n=1 Tax=Ustilago bromivora TaxID=307758 RepID=A0A1K0HC75_9BASI|nr:related to DNA polymerase alpha 70 kDa subunit [Ustilago bromivora]SYW82531.1 related to DNA polymerase alpha 70 kDa subunit [Ustilago bromivora]
MVVATDLTIRLSEHFGPHLASNPALLSETTSICTHYGVSPEDLFYKWEAFAFNHKLPKSEPLTIDHARELRKIIASSINSSSAGAGGESAGNQTPLKPSSALNRGKVAGDFSAMLGIKGTPTKTPSAMGGAFQTPQRQNHSPYGGAGATPASASAYKPSANNTASAADVTMAEIDSPLRPHASTTSTNPAFSIIESLNESIPLSTSGSQLCPPTPAGAKKPNSRVSLAMATDPKAWNYRYMFEKKGERSQVLDDRIDEFASLLRTAYNIDESEEFGDPSLPSQEPIWVVGRICPALPAPESSAGQTLRSKAAARSKAEVEGENAAFGLPKLAETGVVLESSRMMGSGNRTLLTFNKGCIVKYTPQDPGTGGGATTLSLFPGQIVMCRGINAGAEKFAVSEIYFPPPLPLAVHTVDEARDHSYSPVKLNAKALNIVAAAGPFTGEEGLEFEGWHRLMDELEAGGLPFPDGSQERRGVPDTLILTGPFISSTHPRLPFSGELPGELFARHFSSRLITLTTKYPATMVVLIPSTDDILNLHSAYPQPSFSKEDTSQWGLPKRVRCLPNPSVFYVNELVLGTTTADSLGDLKSEEFVTRIESSPHRNPNPPIAVAEAVAGKNKEPNTRYSRSIISQRSFYPLFPPSTSSNLAYDTSHSHLLNFPAVTPDLLILPSGKITKPFIRVVNSATVIQPGSVAKGSVVAVQVDPMKKEQLEARGGMDQINSSLWDRARIDLVSL